MKEITLIFPKNDFLIDPKVFPPLGILYLSSFLKSKDIDVRCIDMNLDDDLSNVGSEYIGISMTTPQRDEAYKVLEQFKGKKTIAGGPHATHMGKECIDKGFNYSIIGYGEIPLLRLLGTNVSNHINIDEFPYPDRDALPIKEYKYYIDGIPATTIMTSRGCLYSCSFCARISKEFSYQSAKRTVDEIIEVNKKYGFEGFMIFDDTFIFNKERIREMINLLGNHNFKFRCFGRSNLINEETIELLLKLGVVEIGLGVESGSNKVLSANMKGIKREESTKAVRLLQSFGIRAKSFLIVGLPGETEETIQETISWIEEARPDDLDVSIFQPYPGSPIFDNPEKFRIKFEYNSSPSWYKGIPGQCISNIETEGLTKERIVHWRNYIEDKYKSKEKLK